MCSFDEEILNTFNYIIYSGVLSNTKNVYGSVVSSAYLSTLLQLSDKQFIFVGDIDLYATDPIWK